MKDVPQIECPNCHEKLTKSYHDSMKMRVVMIKWDVDGCKAVCKSCKADVSIDFEVLKNINTFFTYEAQKDLDIEPQNS